MTVIMQDKPLALVTPTTLTALVDRAASSLAGARSAAEILEAVDLASVAYDAAKKAARLGKAKQAHDDLIAAAYRAQADALEIDAGAKRRLADEYDAAQERGEARTRGGDRTSKPSDEKFGPSDIGMTDTQIHEARKIRDAEKADPGVIKRTLTEAVESGQEPTRAKVKKAISLPSWKKNLLKKARSLQPEPPRGRKAINRCTRAMSSFVLAVMREIDTSEHADLFAALRDELDDLESISKRNHEAAR